MTEHVLISPLGFAAGAVSGVYFALKEQRVAVDRVITVGTRHDDVLSAAEILERLFRRVGDVDYKPCYIDAIDLKGPERDASGPFAARMGLYIDQARKAEQTVHVAVTGGRSGMGALAALAAQLYQADHLYHLWVDEEIELHGIARAEPDPENKYVNPTIEPGLCELVALPFANLSKLVEAVQSSPTELPERWAELVAEKAPIALDTLTGYVPPGLSLRSARELLSLGEQWRVQGEVSQESRSDVYYAYEMGLDQLRGKIDRRDPRYLDLLVYEQRLGENIAKARLYGDTPTRSAERSEVIHRLNDLALSALNESFNGLCDSVSKLGREQIWLRTLSVLYSAGSMDDAGRRPLRNLRDQDVASDYGKRALKKAAQGDDLGFFRWLTENEEALTALSKMAATGASVGTFVLKGIELWLKTQGMI
jgi:chorismate mutase